MKRILFKIVLCACCLSFTWPMNAQTRVLEPFTTSNSSWTTPTTGASLSFADGYANCSMVLSGTKYRGDLQFTNATVGSGITLSSAKDVYIAIKFSTTRPSGSLKFEMRRTDATGGSGTRTDGYYNTWTGGNPSSIVASDGGYIYYYNLTSDTAYVSQTASAKEMQYLKFIIADATVEPYSYSVDWIATFPTLADITTYKDYDDDGTSGISLNGTNVKSLSTWGTKENIYLQGADDGTIIAIYSISGSLLLSTKATSGTTVIPSTASGVFLINAINNGKLTVVKLIKK